MRVCLDTNVLVAAFATRGLCADIVRLVLAEHDLVLPEQVAEELVRVLRSGKMRVSAEAMSSVEAALGRFPRVPSPAEWDPVGVADPDDEVVLASAVAAGSEILVSGDGDLLDVAERSPIPIVTPRAFWTLISHG